MEYKINKPYPLIKVERKNKYYADLLLSDYAGINGELTAITQYVFQDFNSFEIYPEVAKALSNIAKVEMIHLELLGKTIKLLGVIPEFKYNSLPYSYTYWNSTNIDYNTRLIKMLKSDILKEQITINNYKKHSSLIKDKYINILLARIIEDEKIHIKCLEKILNTINFQYNN